MYETKDLLINLILYGILPLWGIAGFVDWYCHLKSHIESTSGLKESLIHSLMGIQMGIPIILGLLYEINVLVLLICIIAWVAHEFVAHWDVYHAAPQRHISLLEMHAHNYLATIPLFLLLLIIVLSWPVLPKLITFDWANQFSFRPVSTPHGGMTYMPFYSTFMGVLCVVPYIEENLRCLRSVVRSKIRSQ
jgi:hypothetical protein